LHEYPELLCWSVPKLGCGYARQRSSLRTISRILLYGRRPLKANTHQYTQSPTHRHSSVAPAAASSQSLHNCSHLRMLSISHKRSSAARISLLFFLSRRFSTSDLSPHLGLCRLTLIIDTLHRHPSRALSTLLHHGRSTRVIFRQGPREWCRSGWQP